MKIDKQTWTDIAIGGGSFVALALVWKLFSKNSSTQLTGVGTRGLGFTPRRPIGRFRVNKGGFEGTGLPPLTRTPIPASRRLNGISIDPSRTGKGAGTPIPLLPSQNIDPARGNNPGYNTILSPRALREMGADPRLKPKKHIGVIQ